MRLLGFLLPAVLLAAGPALAEHPAECRVAENQVENDFRLPRVIAALASKRLEILVMGAGSSALPGADGISKAYPARLQHVLTEKLPGVAIKVTTDVKSGRTAPDALKAITASLAAAKPALMIWQAGTVDAMRSVELDVFSAALDKGVETAHAAGSDVILINAQYSPRTESLIALGLYTDNMRWVALQREIPLFDRFSVMKLWAELGTFDFFAITKKLDTAERVHDCIARLLSDLIVDGAKPVAPSPEGLR